MTEQEILALKSLLAKARKDPNLPFGKYEPSARGQHIADTNKLMADLRKTAKNAGPRAKEAIEAHIQALEIGLDFWKGPQPIQAWRERQMGYERASELVAELEELIPPEPPPPPPVP